MNADELDTMWRRYEGVGPRTVDLLVQHGYLDTVVEAARAGEWFCAERAVRELAGREQRDEAWELLAPYVATGWWGAVRAGARLREEWGRGDEAVALVRGYTGRDERLSWVEWAGRRAALGRVDEAIAVVRPHLQDWFLLEALAEATAGHGRDAEVIALLEPLAEQKLRGREPWNAPIMLARVLDRAGRGSEAVELLRAHLAAGTSVSHNEVEALASLLGRHGRDEELHALATSDRYAAAALRPLVTHLVAHDRADDAIAFLRAARVRRVSRADDHLVSLLGRLGRLDDALEAVEPALADASCGCLLTELFDYLATAERADDALKLLDRAAEVNPVLGDEMGHARSWLLSASGRHDEAIAVERARPVGEYGRARGLAAALEAAGRTDEALAVLEAAPDRGTRTELARLLILAGRPDDAVAAHRAPAPAAGGDAEDPPF